MGGTTVTISAQLCDGTTGVAIRTPGLVVSWSSGGLPSVTDNFGIATTTLTTAAGAGNTYNVTATDTTPVTGTSATITTIAVAGPAALFNIAVSSVSVLHPPTLIYTAQVGDPITLVAQLTDADNNPIATAWPVNWAVATGAGGSFGTATPNTGNTDNTGLSMITFTTAAAKATYRITASGGGAAGTAPPITTASPNYTAPNKDSLGGLGTPTAFVDFSEIMGVISKYGCNGCHNASNGGYPPPVIPNYDNAADAYLTLVNQQSNYDNNTLGTLSYASTGSNSDSSEEKRVSPLDAANSFIFFKTNNTDPPYGLMPLGNPSNIATTDMQLIRDWINQGCYRLSDHYIVTVDNANPVGGADVTISAQLQDDLNNPLSLPGRTVTWSLASGSGGTFSNGTTTITSKTNSSGIATVTFTTSIIIGVVYQFTATDSNGTAHMNGTTTLRTGTGGTCTTVAAPGVHYVVTSTAPGNSPVVNTAGIILTAQLTDPLNNSLTYSGPPLNVTWTDPSNDGTFTSLNPSPVNSQGQATITFTCGTIAQNITTITATDTSLPTNITGNIVLHLKPDVAKNIVFSASSPSPVAGSTVSIFGQLEDQYNNLSPTPGINVTWNDHGSGGFPGSSLPTDATGKATLSYTTTTTPGKTYTIDGISTGLASGLPVVFKTVTGPAAKYLVSALPASPIAGVTPVSVTAQLVDANNNPVNASGLSINWSKTTALGSFSSVTTVNNGQATATFNTSTVAGPVTITATDNSSPTHLTGSFTFTSIAGPPTQFLMSSSSFNPLAGSAVTITAQQADSNGNPVPGALLQITWSDTGAGGSLASPTSLTNAGGAATVQFTVSKITGTTHTVTATDGGGQSFTSAPIKTVTGPPSFYQIAPSTLLPVVGSTMSINAQLADANGNPVAASGRSVSWSATATGVFNFASSTDAGGLASVQFTPASSAGVTFTITGIDTNGINGTSVPLKTVAGATAAYVVKSSNNTPVAGGPVTITAQLVDANGNPVSVGGHTVSWTNTGVGTFSAASSTTGPTGAATVVFTTGSTIGIFTVTAKDGSGFSGSTSAIGTTSGKTASYIVSASSTSIVAGNGVRITAQAVDANGNFAAAAGTIVTWSSSGGGSFSSATSTTDTSGHAGVEFIADLTPNASYTVTAADAGGANGVSPVISAVAGLNGATNGATLGAPVITSALSATGGVSAPFTFTVAAMGDSTIVFSATALPPGLVLSGNTISGTPLQPGTFVVHLTAANSAGADHEDIVVQIAPQQDLSVERVQIKLKFAPGSTTSDRLSAAFSVTLPIALDRGTATMDVYFGALKWTGLTAFKTRAVQGMAALAVRPAARGSSALMMNFKISKVNLKALAQNGLTNQNAFGQALSVPVAVTITTNGKAVACSATVNLIYTCNKDRFGQAKKAP